MGQESQTYREDYRSVRVLLMLLVCIQFCIFTFIYYRQYEKNHYHFYVPSQQLAERATIDSIEREKEIADISSRLNASSRISNILEIEMAHIPRAIRLLTSRKPLPDTVWHNETKSYAIYKSFGDASKDGDTLFIVYSTADTLYQPIPITLKLKFEEGKFGSNQANNEGDNIRDKLSYQYSIITKQYDDVVAEQVKYKQRLEYLQGRKLDYTKGAALDLMDFAIFSANIHTTFGFNGIVPASKQMRFWCLIHKISVIVIYYFIYTKFKSKKP